MNTHTNTIPSKVADFAQYLDRNNIPYTLESKVSDYNEHTTFYTFRSVDGRWFESTVHTMFCATAKHTNEYGHRKNSSQSHVTTWASGATVNKEIKRMSSMVYAIWSTYAVKEGK